MGARRKIMPMISALLVAYREQLGLTQHNLVVALGIYDEIFKNLNTVTLSRWETGTTSPSISRKQKILHFLKSKDALSDIPECKMLLTERYKQLYEPLTTLFQNNYQYLIGNFPEFEVDKSHVHCLREYALRDEYIEHIIDIETVTNVAGYYSVNKATFASMCVHPSSFTIICERKKQHLGHFVMFKIKTDVAKEIVHHRRGEHTLTVDDLCGVNEKGTYYVHALFGKNPKIAALLNVQAYLYLLEHMDTIENILIFATRKDGVLLTRDYGIKLVEKGIDETYGFEWYGMMSPVEDILFSKTIVELLF